MEKSEVTEMGREKKYTARSLEKAVNAYFRAIRRTVPVWDYEETGEYTKKGMPIMKRVQALNDDKEPMTTVEYVRPPSLTALCLALGISRTTWAKYGRDESMAPIVEAARMENETYWAEQLSGRNAQGAKFALQNACGWRGTWSDKMEVELGPETRKQQEVKAMTMEEKMAVIQAAGMAMAEDRAALEPEPETAEEGDEL